MMISSSTSEAACSGSRRRKRSQPTYKPGPSRDDHACSSKPAATGFGHHSWAAVCTTAVAVAAMPYLLSLFKQIRAEQQQLDVMMKWGEWSRDEVTETMLVDGAGQFDVQHVDLNEADLTARDFHDRYRFQEPVLVSGKRVMERWSARRRWKKETLREAFGRRLLHTGSGGDIVSSGGGVGLTTRTFSDFLDRLNASSVDAFTFDTAFSAALPELSDDFETPGWFMGFNNPSSIKRGQSWHMLSIGGSRQGLPFHVHGETWLGVMFGYKTWYIYPPGKGVGSNISSMDVWTWYTHVLPTLTPAERPLHCVQRPGDVMYLPAGWKHLTINVGEVIAVGGQAAYPAEQRLQDSLNVLRANPYDYEALYGAGLSMAHKSTGDKLPTTVRDRFMNQAHHYLKRAISLRPCQPDAHLLLGELLAGQGTKTARRQAMKVIHSAELLLLPDQTGSPCALPDYVSTESRQEALSHVRLKLARVYMMMSEWAEAERLLRFLVGVKPSIRVLWDLIHVFAEQGKKSEASQAAVEAVLLEPNNYQLRAKLKTVAEEYDLTVTL